MKLKVGDKVRITSDKAYKYRGYRFQILAIEGDLYCVGNFNGLIEIHGYKDDYSCVKVKSPKNICVDEYYET